MAHDIIPGDVIEYPWGINRVPEVVTVHHVYAYPDGALFIRFRFTSNPRGIDWSGFVTPDETGIRLLSRGVAAVDSNIRSLLP